MRTSQFRLAATSPGPARRLTPFGRLLRFRGQDRTREPRMRYVRWFALWAALLGSAPALAGLAEVTVIDRDTGASLAPHYFHGEYWIAGRPGARYAIEIRNRDTGRVLAVTSVDGVNVVTGETAGWSQNGYVLSAGQQYQITGWRKSDVEVAAFTFTALPESYAALTGRPANVGVIGVALFRERPPPVVSIEESESRRQAASPDAAAAARPEPASPDAAGAARAQRSAPDAAAAFRAEPSSPAPLPADPSLKSQRDLGTGHGPREYSYVNHTEFTRMQDQPNEVIRIRYDSLERLVAMGIVRRPHVRPVGADPFPASASHYVPDPPG